MNDETNIHCYTEGALAFCLLDRPKQLNALTLAMNQVMREALLAWKEDPAIKAIVITSSSDRAFCAGGDIKLAYKFGQEAPEKALSFFELEYEINLLIATYPKPIIVFCQGIIMGGGCGIGFHASHAIAGDRIKLAMPEANIGLFPDIGASYVLPRLKNHIGYYLGLTGHSIGQADVMYTGLMQYGMDDSAWKKVLVEIKQIEWGDDAFQDIDAVLKPFVESPDLDCELAQKAPWIQRLFGSRSLAEVFELPNLLHSDPALAWQESTINHLKTRCPQSLAMTWEAFHRGAKMTLEQVLEQDLKLVSVCLNGKNFYHGVHACLIEHREPQWQQPCVNAYSKEQIAAWFE
jgi:enoyl-CoA hydratase